MPVKVNMHDNTSQVDVAVKSSSKAPVSPSNNTLADKRLYLLIKEETKNRIAEDANLQQQIDDIAETGAGTIVIEEKGDGSIEVSLLNTEGTVLSTATIHLTEKIIKSGIVDYAHSKVIFTCNDDSTIEVDISDIVNAIIAENNRAMAAEAVLGQRIDSEATTRQQADVALNDAISLENTRATGVENQLRDDLTTETNARTAADTQLQSNLDAEAHERSTYDESLSIRISNEAGTRLAADDALNARIDALDLATVGAAGSYLKTVSQSDGQVAATAQQFDTVINYEATDLNAPTTKAVRDFVDANGGKIDTISINGVNQPAVNKNVDLPAYPTRVSLNINNVDNTADLDKPVSTATQTALNKKQNIIDQEHKLSSDLVDDSGHTNKFATQAQLDQISTNKSNIATLDSTVSGHVANTSNPHNVTKTQVGLGNVDNTSDLDKPVSTLQQEALDAKQDVIDSSHKLASDLVDDSASTNKFVTASDLVDIAANTAARHTHTNFALLETYAQTEVNLADAVAKKHSHSNKAILDSTEEAYTTFLNNKLQGIESGAEVNEIEGIQRNGVDLVPDSNRKVNIVVPTQTSDLTNNGDGTSNYATVNYVDTEIATKQPTIDPSNPLDADSVDDTTSNHKFVTASEKSQITTNQTDISNLDSTLDAHLANTSNPHAVTKAQVGLGDVVNTGDSATPAENGTTKFTTGGAYTMQTTLQGNIDTVDNKLNYNVHIESGDEMSYNGDTVTKTSGYRNLKTGATGSRSEVIHLANSTTAGMMSPTDYNQIRTNTSRIANLEGQTKRLLYSDKTNPTQQEIQDFVDDYLISIGIPTPQPEDYAGIAVVVAGTYHIWHYYSDAGVGWKDDGADTVSQFTNAISGTILGKVADGFVYAENDGTGSVYGWSALKTRVENLETADQSIQQDITALQNNKVDKVTGKDLSTNDFTNAYKEAVDLNTAARHTHSNLALLETYNQTNADLANAVLKAHEHSNKTILDNTTASYTTGEATKLSGIEAGAEVNDIVGIQRNSVDLTPDANRKVNIVVPTQTSDLTNNGDGTSNYATESYVATEIAAKQNTIDASHPLNADFVDDSTSAHKFVSAADLTNIAANTAARHTHTNFSLLETYTQTNTDLANAVAKAHEHANKALLDSYDQTNANISDAVSKKHEHANKTILDNTTASFTTNKDTKLSGIETGAEVNEIEGVKVNGNILTPDADRIVSLTVPTKTSDITNDGEGGLSKFATENYVDTAVNNKQPTIDSAHPLNADYVDDSTSDHKFVSAADLANIASNTAARHTHSNYALLESYTQSNAALVDAVTKAHTHSNKSVLDDTTAAFTTTKDTKLNGIEDGAEVNDIVSISVNNSALTPDANRNVNIDLSVYALEGDLSTVAITGSYTDLNDKPSIPTKNSWNYDDRYVKYNDAQSLNDTEKARARSNIGAGTSNFSGSYNDLVDKPTIPVVYDGTLYLQKNGATIATFTANQSGNTTANFTIPTNLDDVPDGQTRKLSNYVAKSGDTMSGNLEFTSGSHIQLSTSSSSSVGNYVSAGGGYSYNSGKYGVKIASCDQGDCISGLGQDLNPNGYPYDFCIVGSNSSGDVGHISFVTHKDGYWTTYREIANFYDNAGNVTFTVNGSIVENGVSLSNKYLQLSNGTSPIHFNTNNLPQFNGSIPYFVGIEAFDDGGTLKWQSASDVSVGYATSAGSASSATSAGYATSAGNADTVDNLHASDFVRTFYNHELGADTFDNRNYLMSGGDTGGSWEGTTYPASAHNGMAILNAHTHPGNYYTQLCLSTASNDLFIRSANSEASFGSWYRLAKSGDNVSSFNNDAGYITSGALSGYATETWVNNNFLSLSGGTVNGATTFNTNTNTTPLVIGRGASRDNECVALGVDDGVFWNTYTNDENSSAIRWTLTNTDTEGSDGSRASSHFMQFSSSNGGASLYVDGYVESQGIISNNTITVNKNGVTTTLGSENSSWFHIQTNNDTPVYFGETISVNGNIEVYNTSWHLNNSGELSANTVKVANKVTMQYNSSEDCLDFVFA